MSWKFDTSHSAIEFSVRHMMISRVRGRFEKFDGIINLDEQNPRNTTVDVTIDAASISTRDAQRDGHLRSADFLNVEQYPTLHFRSTRVDVTSANTALLHGDLTIAGQARPVTLDVTFVGKSQSPWGHTSYGFEGSTKISRKEWGLVWNVGLETGGVLVSDEIAITIELELVQVVEEPVASETQPEAVAV